MPCKTGTITAATQPNIQEPQVTLTTGTNELTLEYSVTNAGNAVGDANVQVLVDVGQNAQIDNSENFTHTIQPGETIQNAVTFTYNLQQDQPVEACANLV